jgi:septal ring factor EnvC (AmiA/AmiB activator)
MIDPRTPLIPAKAGIQNRWVPAFRLRAPRFGGLEPAEARKASKGWVAGTSGRGAAMAFVFLVLGSPATKAQDVRGLEVCTAEKQMDRRTGCLQANIDYLMQLIDKNARDARQKLDAAAKDLSAAKNEVTALKASLAAMQARLEKLEKPKDAK